MKANVKSNVKSVEIVLDEQIGFYTILVNGEAEYECLAPDEVMDCVAEVMER